jgi:hypothetical protein
VATVEPTSRPGRGRLLGALLALLAWPLGPWLGVMGFLTTLPLMGEQPDADERRQAAWLLLGCVVVSVGTPVLALVLARDRRAVRVPAVLLLGATAVLVPTLVVVGG